ncbi:kinase-like domain-containing protein [Collybia nuda]|uniref:non-specific serine/threonine protein kinase n=1 Tax=Collybia nuda TaxID=64659 RepID=A0A9P6C7U2_9AGAR|nr:kinase-like domain-containing protein [Collybia nuda]
MAPKLPCAKYQYVVTPAGPKILPVEEPSCKDEESPADYNAGGYLPVKVNDTFKDGRYRVIRKLGWGHFSTVWLVKDTVNRRHSALKVVKSAGRYAETARDEIKLLSQVSSVSPTHPGRSHIVSFLDSFFYQGPEASHVCIIFEPLGENLLAMIERNKKKGVPRALVKMIAKQILLGLQYLHDECDLVHTDIKPENILISIPDIEVHIQNEISQSPSPTSRRVGVPLPTRSRAGVSIPQHHQRTRRQVQIFDSQPLASPSRSADITRNHHNSMSINARNGNSGSGSNSVSGSYVAQMHISRLTGSGNTAVGTAKSLSSSVSKLSQSGLSASAPRSSLIATSKSDSRLYTNKGTIVGIPSNFISSSTSSSSSSISSTLASTTAGSSSIISTPPTSLSHSLGNVVAGFMGIGNARENSAVKVADDCKLMDQERTGLPVKGRKGKEKMSIEDELQDASSTPWKGIQNFTGSWKEKPSTFSSYISGHDKSKLSEVHNNGQSHVRFGLPLPSSWQDPGVAAPAPALVVSAVVGADGEENVGNYFDFSGTGTVETASTSESSSATATLAQPSRNVSPNQSERSPLGTNSLAIEASPIINRKPIASLLTQTAPSRTSIRPSSYVSSTKRTSIRPSPPHHVSQLSAHMHSYPISPSQDNIIHSPPSTVESTNHVNYQNVPIPVISPSSLTPTPITPNAPPPTPIASPPATFLIPTSTSIVPQRSAPPIELPIGPPALTTPPISIKIADLGNATPSKKHYTEDIQTRQYRAPEAILGKRDWDARADIWSVACVVFELLTAEFLFDPHGQGELFTKDDDHMAQIIELLGDFSLDIKMGGKYSRELFDHTGTLRYIRTLKPWPMKRVMMEKYLFAEADADNLCEFLLPMLEIDMKKRVHARDMLNHRWLALSPADEVVGEW